MIKDGNLKMSDVFISYKAEEYEEASGVKKALEKNGISCWMAPESIIGGSSYAAEIPKAIKECRVFVIILSEKVQNSKWVPREIDQAINQNKVIMPFAIENCPLKDEFNFYLTNVQRFEAYKNKSEVIEKMIFEIKAILNIQDLKETKPQDRPSVENNDKVVLDDSAKLKKKKISVKEKNEDKRFDVKKAIKILIAVFVIVVALFFVIFGKNLFVKSIDIAGEKVKVNSTYLNINDIDKLTSDDVYKISSLEMLNNLSIDNCKLPDNALQVFSHMNLVYLSLDNCSVNDKDLSNADFSSSVLKTLNLNNNQISDLSNIKDLSGTLDNFSIDNNPISDFSVLENFDLVSFSANGAGVKSLDFISNYKKINEIYVNNNSITTLSPLFKCTSILNIEVSGNKLKNLSGLENSLSLAFVKADSNKISSIDALSNQTCIVSCSFNGNRIKDISVLAKSSEYLQSLSVNENLISDISPLLKCNKLETICIDNNKISSIKSLENKVKLQTFSAKNNQISDLTPLKNSVNINHLDLSGNEISNISALNGVFDDSYVYVDLSMNQITNFDLPYVSYYVLNLYGNKIENYLDIFSRNITTLVIDYSQSIDAITDYPSSVSTTYFVDCPKDKQIKTLEIFKNNAVFITPNEINEILK